MRAGGRLLWPAIWTSLLVLIALALGIWQVQRLAWKERLLADIAAGESQGPVPLGPSPPPFRRVLASGQFVPGVYARYGVEVRAGAMGSHLLALLRQGNGDAILVDRGWAPEGFDPLPPSGNRDVLAYVRPGETPTWFSPTDDIAARHFYTLNPARIGAALGTDQVAPYVLVALGRSESPPFPATALPSLPNNHLSYAITWFAMAFLALLLFGAYVRSSREQSGRRTGTAN